MLVIAVTFIPPLDSTNRIVQYDCMY